MSRKRSPSSRSPFERDLDRAVEACRQLGLGLAVHLTERGIEIPYVAIEEGHRTGQGIGARGMALILAVAESHGRDVLVPPSNGGSQRFFARLGFSWPDDEAICAETDLMCMVRRAGANRATPEVDVSSTQPKP